jgi:hypothetical protein
MRWFRANTKFGSRLALVALAIQLILSFSHIDLCDFGAAPAKAATLAVGSGPSGPGKAPPVDNPDRRASCPICALIQLAATATPSAPPALPLPMTPGHIRAEASDQLLLAASAQFPFRARAPPAV